MKTGANKKALGVIVITLFFLFLPAAAETYVMGEQRTPVTMPAEGASYVGAAECRFCHVGIHNNWTISGHKYMLMTPDEALEIRPDLPMPEGYAEEDILYVIGGWGWKARYMNEQGYIITETGENLSVNGSNQYNIETGEWVDYHPGEVLEYDCQSCHTTGASYDSATEGKPGINGSWEFPGIQCEACHGAGSVHVAEKGVKGVAITVDRDASLCGQCHQRGDREDRIPASGGFIRHQEQYQEFLASGKMSKLDCVVCHDPHSPVHAGATNPVEGAGIKRDCSDCHVRAAEIYNQSAMGTAGVECVDCHMPKVVRTAVNVSQYEADVRTHLFKINTDADAEFTYTDPEDGNEYANPHITLEYACLQCHGNRDKAWAAEVTPLVINHSIEEEIEIPGTPAAEGVHGPGVFISLVVLIIVYLFRRK